MRHARITAANCNACASAWRKNRALPVTDDSLRDAIKLFNRHRTLLNEMAHGSARRGSGRNGRRAKCTRLPPPEMWDVLRRAHPFAERALLLGETRTRPQRDAGARGAARGAFCEQPPPERRKCSEDAGCAVVDDDLQVGGRFLSWGRWRKPAIRSTRSWRPTCTAQCSSR